MRQWEASVKCAVEPPRMTCGEHPVLFKPECTQNSHTAARTRLCGAHTMSTPRPHNLDNTRARTKVKLCPHQSYYVQLYPN
mmetsp:Transcript_3330/g.9309  ORF Transcript_3330/g.9309 Transcript_3330/m.9309 type:complete len:81 (+) Transcript_3330:10-252(+)